MRESERIKPAANPKKLERFMKDSENISRILPDGSISDEGQKEGFKTFQKISDNTASVDSDAINNIGKLTSEYMSASQVALANAETECERSQRLNDAKEVFRGARDDILEINRRSHQSQRGFSNYALIGITALAGLLLSGGMWLLSKDDE